MGNEIIYNDIPREGLVAEFLLNGNADNSYGTNWTASNVTWTDSEKWYVKEHWKFTSSSSFTYSPLNQLSQWTITLWFKLNNQYTSSDTSTISFIYGNKVWSNTWDFQLQLRQNLWNAYFRSEVAGIDLLSTQTSWETNKWYMLTVTWDWVNKYMYVDWKFDTQIADSSPYFASNQTQTALFVDTPNKWITWYWMRVYNRALTQNEIHQLYIEWQRRLWIAPSYPSLLSWTVAYYDFRWDASNIITGDLATVSWATLTTDHLGNSNSAYSFDGVDDYIRTWQIITWNRTIFSIFKWAWTGWASIFWNLRSSGNWWIAIWLRSDNDYIRATWGTGSWYWEIMSTVNGRNWNWHTAMITIEWVTKKLYVDWNYIWSSTITLNDASLETIIWATSIDYNNDFTWDISLCLQFTKIYSEVEYQSLHKLTKETYIYPFSKSSTLNLQDGLVMSLNGSWVDLSGNWNNGTPTNVTPIRIGQHSGGSYNGSMKFNIMM